ncbi:MAG: hypothetical protein HC902_11935 [Calothrix sp. SM1_5_4]|nr:hypothetical protein [Calothrix sp. SM1_5_4]
MIGEAELESARAAELPRLPAHQRRVHAPYYVLSALKEFQSWDLETEDGARLYTALDPDVQSAMTETVAKILPAVEKKAKARVRQSPSQPLQTAAITVDLLTAEILGLVGGRDFKTTQYNRATDARRQIGSIVKPFVYWGALKERSPLDPIVDEPFEWKSGKQTWRPKNYDNKYLGPIPLFFALAESRNVPAAKIGQEIGLNSVADTIRRTGIRAEVPELPSLTLGAFELSLAEVAQGFSTLARFGRGDYLHQLIRVEDGAGNILFQPSAAKNLELDPAQTAVLVGMMRQAFEVGTAKAARAWGTRRRVRGKNRNH